MFDTDNRIRQLRFMISIYFGHVWAGFREQTLVKLGVAWRPDAICSISLDIPFPTRRRKLKGIARIYCQN